MTTDQRIKISGTVRWGTVRWAPFVGGTVRWGHRSLGHRSLGHRSLGPPPGLDRPAIDLKTLRLSTDPTLEIRLRMSSPPGGHGLSQVNSGQKPLSEANLRNDREFFFIFAISAVLQNALASRVL